MRPSLRILIVPVILVGGYMLFAPAIDRMLYTLRLVTMDKPVPLPMPVEGLRARALRDTPVVSSTEGIVTQFGTNRLGGLVVWVRGSGCQRLYYAHLDRYADVEAGMRVAAGRVLGYAGTTGNAQCTPPHLHYGVYEVDGAINPYPVLRAAPRG